MSPTTALSGLGREEGHSCQIPALEKDISHIFTAFFFS